MIKTFRHNGLEKYFRTGNKAGIIASQEKRIRIILRILDSVKEIRDINLPGMKLHLLSGNLKGFWAVSLTGNRRIIFRFDGTDIYDVDCVDYH